MIQMLLSEWIVRIFLLYLFVVGGLVLIRHQQRAVSRPFVFSPVTDIHARWAAHNNWWANSRPIWWDKYPKRDNLGVRIGRGEPSDGEFWRNDNLRYA